MTTLPPSDPPPPPGRPWLAPAVASGLALVTLAVLSIPGVLRFPAAGPPAEDPAALAGLVDGNRALEAEIARLQGATQGGVCVYDGAFYPSAVEEGTGAPPAERRLDLLAPPPAAARPAPDALPPASAGEEAFDGRKDWPHPVSFWRLIEDGEVVDYIALDDLPQDQRARFLAHATAFHPQLGEVLPAETFQRLIGSWVEGFFKRPLPPGVRCITVGEYWRLRFGQPFPTLPPAGLVRPGVFERFANQA